MSLLCTHVTQKYDLQLVWFPISISCILPPAINQLVKDTVLENCDTFPMTPSFTREPWGN
jgi:hypothetical protein